MATSKTKTKKVASKKATSSKKRTPSKTVRAPKKKAEAPAPPTGEESLSQQGGVITQEAAIAPAGETTTEQTATPVAETTVQAEEAPAQVEQPAEQQAAANPTKETLDKFVATIEKTLLDHTSRLPLTKKECSDWITKSNRNMQVSMTDAGNGLTQVTLSFYNETATLKPLKLS